MPTETAETKPAETTQSAAAPAAAAEAATASDTKSDSGSAPASGTAETEAKSDPWSPDSFEWDSWDGSSYDPFPEEIRPLAEKFGKWHSTRLESVEQDRARLQSLYDAILDGEEDPRIAELTGKYSEADKARMELEQQSKTYQSELASVIQWVSDREAERAAAEADAFQAANQWLFTPEYQPVAVELLDAGWEPKHLPKLAKLPKSVRDSASQILAEVKNPDIALRVALAEAKPNADDGTAPFVAGSTSPAPAARTAEKPNTAGLSGKDRILATVRSNMRNAKKR